MTGEDDGNFGFAVGWIVASDFEDELFLGVCPAGFIEVKGAFGGRGDAVFNCCRVCLLL